MSINTFLRLLILSFALLLLLPSLALAQDPGDLDPSFGRGGIVTTNFADENESHAQALVLQPDGKIVAGGYNHNGGSIDFSLIRYFPDGSLDPTFDGDGKVTTKFGVLTGSRVSVLALQPDGKIVAAGESYDGRRVIALARYHPDGGLDLTFGGDGKVTTYLNYYQDYPQALAIQPDGKIVVAAVGLTNFPYGDIILIRYNADGSLDASFGDDGKVSVPLKSRPEYRTFLVLQPDGKIVVTGYNGYDITFVLARYQSDGTLDPTFDSDGLVIGPEDSAIYALELQPDGKLLVAGFGLGIWGLARYNVDGTPDSTFDGLYLGDIDTPLYNDFAMILQPDGKIVAAGLHQDDYSVILVRHNPDGSLDPSFDGDGWLTTPLRRSYDDKSGALALQPGGEIIIAGLYATGQQEDFALARYNPDGSPDLSFDGDGWVVTQAGSSYDAIAAMALQPDGKIVVAGTSIAYYDSDVALARYNPDGSLDTGFGNGGKLRTHFNGSREDYALDLALQPNGKIIITGVSQEASDQPFALARYNPDGSLDPTFDGDGKLTTYIGRGGSYANAVVVQPDGKIVVGGYSYSVSQNMALVRYHPDGSLDPSFDGDGKLISSFGSKFSEPVNALVLQPDGKIVIAGQQNNDLLLVRYNPDGSLDSTFSGDGVVTTTFNAGLDNWFMSLVQQADGKLVAAGSSDGEVALARYNPDGSLDPTFDGDGKVMTKLNEGLWLPALALQPNGKLLIAGAIEDGDSGNTVIIRYNPDGSLDPTFDGDGHLIMNASNERDWVEDITLQPDGKIVAAGLAELPSPDFMVVRYLNPDIDLGLIKSVYPPLARPGQTITYTLAFSNTGTEPATGVVITDMIPTSFTVQSISNGGATITQAATSPAYVWMVRDLAPGEGGLITLTGQISPTLAQSGRFTNTATIAADQGINPANDTAVAGVEVTVPSLAFEGTPYRVGEAATEAVITITLSPASLGEVTVDYNTIAGGTAQAGHDYASTAGSLSFMAGLTVATFTIPISDDRVAEGNETVKLRLSHPSGASLAPLDQQASLTLIDDDTAGLRLPMLLTATEGLTTTYLLYLTSRPTAPVTITLTTDDQVEVKPNRLVFMPPAWNQPQHVIVTALVDRIGEGNHSGTISHTLTSSDPVYADLGKLILTVKLKETSKSLFLPVLLRQAASDVIRKW